MAVTDCADAHSAPATVVADLGRSPKMSTDLPISPVKEVRVWLFWLSVAMQQIIFLLAFGLRIPLVGISTWVIYVPIVIIWVLYYLVPLLGERKEKKYAVLRAYALTGWVFVAAAVSWTTLYIVLSKKYGTPVSYELYHERQSRANQALQHNDPGYHVSCLRTPRASRDRG